jgi:2-oxoisovalerate dehydrogenase E2 component (dihydrolipoyl transacylase)
VEITSPFDGIVKELLVQEGEVAKVGEGLCLIEVDEETVQDTTDIAHVEPVSSLPEGILEPTTSAYSKDETSDPKDQEVQSHGQPVSKPRLHPLDPNYTPDSMSTASSNVLATPSVRHFSRQKGVDLEQLAPGSGKCGRIEKKDVEAYLARGTIGNVEGVGASAVDGKDIIVELGRTRYGMWKAMVKVHTVSSKSLILF